MGNEDDHTTDLSTLAGGEAPTPGPRDRPFFIVLRGSNAGEMFRITDGAVIGRGAEAGVRVQDDLVSRAHARVVREGDALVVEDLESANGTFVNGRRVARHVLHDGDKLTLGTTTVLKFTFHDDLEESFQRELYEAALLDVLTKAYNRRYFMRRAEVELAFAQRSGQNLSLITFDIDHFKQVNDTHGHAVGDEVLIEIAKIAQHSVRRVDLLARMGGEEFAVLCRSTDAAGAMFLAERLRGAVAIQPLTVSAGALRATISVGVATFPHPAVTSLGDLLEHADQAMYRAKREGRNRVIAAP